MDFAKLNARARCAGRWSVIALGCSIPISVAIDNFLLLAVALAWLAAGDYRATVATLRENRVALAASVLFGLLLLGLAYGGANPGAGTRYLGKYVDLMFVPLFMVFFRDPDTRNRALAAFAIAAVASIIVSHFIAHGLLERNPVLPRSPQFPGGFKFSITHSLIIGLAAFLFAVLAREAKTRPHRIGFAILALLAAHNVLFMVIGRTGQVVLVLLFFYFFVVTWGRRGLILVTLLSAATLLTAYATSDTFKQRTDVAVQEFNIWQPGNPSDTSVGLRLEWYANSLAIVREHPLTGTGTGSFPATYARAVSGRNMVETENPHNEYLLIAVQLGLLGVVALVALFWQLWRYAGRLENPANRDLARGLAITYVIGCLFNSLLVDHTEGLLFAWLAALFCAAPVRTLPARATS
jgi:O-antigen ligase